MPQPLLRQMGNGELQLVGTIPRKSALHPQVWRLNASSPALQRGPRWHPCPALSGHHALQVQHLVLRLLPSLLSKKSPVPTWHSRPAAETADTNIRGTCSPFGVLHLGLAPGMSGNPCRDSVPLSCLNCSPCSRLLKVWNQLLVRFLWLRAEITASDSAWIWKI